MPISSSKVKPIDITSVKIDSSKSKLNDIFISYHSDSNQSILNLLEKLVNNENFNVWIDKKCLDHNSKIDSHKQSSEGILNSKIFVCFITKKYSNSTKCKKEISYAKSLNKNIIALMMEKYPEAELDKLGDVGSIIKNCPRIKCYKDKDYIWVGQHYDNFIKLLKKFIFEKLPEKINENEKSNFFFFFSFFN